MSTVRMEYGVQLWVALGCKFPNTFREYYSFLYLKLKIYAFYIINQDITGGLSIASANLNDKLKTHSQLKMYKSLIYKRTLMLISLNHTLNIIQQNGITFYSDRVWLTVRDCFCNWPRILSTGMTNSIKNQGCTFMIMGSGYHSIS